MKRILLCLIALSFASPSWAAMQQVRVMAVGMDRSAARAEEMAIDYAKKRAVYLTARKLPVDNVSAKVAAFTPEQFREIVRGATVSRLKRDGERTYADVSVTIVDSALKRALKLEEAQLAEGPPEDTVNSRGVLTLPIYVTHARPYLWEKENLLRAPVQAEVMRQAHGSVLLAAGDLDDLRLIDYANALSVTGEELKPMFERYGADEIVLAIFTLEATGAQGEAAKPASILLRRLTPTASRAETVRLPAPGKEKLTTDQQVRQAAQLIAGALNQIALSTSAADRERLAKATKLPILFKYANPRELAQMQDRVRTQREVLLVTLPAIGLGEIKGVAYIDGDREKLREKLVKTGMIVADSGDGWQLSLR